MKSGFGSIVDGAVDDAQVIGLAELSKGQMVEDVRLIVNGKKPVEFYGRTGGHVINTEELIEVIEGGKR